VYDEKLGIVLADKYGLDRSIGEGTIGIVSEFCHSYDQKNKEKRILKFILIKMMLTISLGIIF
jgi:hypothetical protein